MRYRYYQDGNRTICVSSFAGKPVRGVAICDSKDTFTEDAGQKVSMARCDVKVANKRVKKAFQDLNGLYEARDTINAYIVKATERYDLARDKQDKAEQGLLDILSSF